MKKERELDKIIKWFETPYASEWKSRTICSDCGYIFSDWEEHIVCPECGSDHNSIKAIRWKYSSKNIFNREIETEIKD